MNGRKDRLYDRQITRPEDFVFDERVVRVFPDMINRSIPGYAAIVPMIGLLARRFAQDNSRLYDLGCSLGAATRVMRKAVRQQGVSIIAVDNSPDMMAGFAKTLREDGPGCPVELVEGDMLEVSIENASVVVMNFSLQFIEPGKRLGLLKKIAQGMRPGAALILSEKIRFPNDSEQALQTAFHHDFKRAQGYSELEIAQKRNALENVMKTDTEEQHLERLAAAGFAHVSRWFQGFCFASYVATR
jgi:tRNA (cmo5U34)-methyltransferase